MVLLLAVAAQSPVFAQDEDAEQEQFKEVPVGEAEEDDSELLTEEVLSDAAGDAEPIVDDIIRVHPLTDIPAPAADVITAVIFPENAKKVFPIGEISTVVVGLQNKGARALNVTGIFGSLNSQFQFFIYIQNFTGQPYGQVVEPGTEASLEYKFFPSPQLDPIELQMALTVFYEDAITHKSYASTFYNGTVDFVDNTSPLDVRSGLKLTLVGGVFAAIVYFMVANGATKKKKGSRTAEVATAKEGEYADAFLQRTAARTGKAAAKKD